MKRHFYFFGGAAIAAVSLAGCVADKDLPTPGSGANTMIVAQTDPLSADTRTAVDPTEYENGEIGINWLPTDRIGVFGNAGTANTVFSNTIANTSPRAVFAGNLKNGETPLVAYYPYSAGAGADPASLSGTLPLVQTFNHYTGILQGDYKYGAPTVGAAEGRFTFNHLFAFLKFDIDATGSTVQNETLKSISLEILGQDVNLGGDFTFNAQTGDVAMAAGANNTVTMKWDPEPVLAPSMFHGYLSVAPVSLGGKDIRITIETSGHIAKFTVNPKVASIERNNYYTLPLKLKEIEDTNETFEIRATETLEQGQVMPGLSSALACANRVFSLPSTPFMHKIRVSDASAVTVYGLPEGLTWNSRRQLVQGQVDREGEYVYTVKWTDASGNVRTEGVSLTVSRDLQMPVPFMGWLSWNVVEKNISETVVREVADALVSKGLAEAGYKYLVIDDFWHAAKRDNEYNPVADASKFPNGIKACSDYTHSKGLKFGIYSDAGRKTCGGMFGSQDFEEEDARAYAEWGVDLLKYDFCFAGNCTEGSSSGVSAETAYARYRTMGEALKAQNRDIILYMCEWGMNQPWKWGAETGATTWRCTYDTRDGWNGKTQRSSVGIGVKQSLEQMRDLWPYAGVNRFNDADMMCVGIHGNGKSSNQLVEFSQSSGGLFNKKNLGMTDDEYQTQFAMWCMWSSPLTLSFDVREEISAKDIAMMTNGELIAINQDPMGQQAEYIKADGDVWYFCKDLANGDVAIAAVNLGSSEAAYTITKGDYDALDGNAYTSRDLINRKDGSQLTATAPLRGTLPAHATAVYRLHAE